MSVSVNIKQLRVDRFNVFQIKIKHNQILHQTNRFVKYYFTQIFELVTINSFFEKKFVKFTQAKNLLGVENCIKESKKRKERTQMRQSNQKKTI